MKIVIDLQALQNGSKNRGIGRYTFSLISAILQSNINHEFILLLNGLFSSDIEKIKNDLSLMISKNNIIIMDLIGDVDYLNDKNNLNRKTSEIIYEKIIADLNPDFFLLCSLFEGSMDNTVTSIKEYFPSIKVGVILYDLIPLMNIDKYLGYKPLSDWYFEKINFLKKADILFSISESSKQEAIDYLNFDDKKIINISSAVDLDKFYKKEKNNQLLLNYGINKPFLMHTSAYEERKNFEGLIEAFSLISPRLRQLYQLVLVCKLDDIQKKFLFSLGRKYGLEDNELILTGFISDSELIDLYSSCYLLVFPSFHEGFGLPILEAMACGSPAIGSNTTSIPEVIGLEDATFNPFSAQNIKEKIEQVLTDQEFYTFLTQHAHNQYKKFSWDKSASIFFKTLDYFDRDRQKDEEYLKINMDFIIQKLSFLFDSYNYSDNHMLKIAKKLDSNLRKIENFYIFKELMIEPLNIRIEGPFDSSYSLALLNRETSRALELLGQKVILHSTEGPGDFKPNQEFLNANNDLSIMHDRVKKYPYELVDITSRNLYPPRVNDMSSKLNMLHHYAWEESGFPREWVDDFNKYLNGMTCLSTHIEKIMIDNGVIIPLLTSGCGVDHWIRVESDKQYFLKAKTFKFLHVSSCFPRKGVDSLLSAYGHVFTSNDDVSLIIKTFTNPHNNVRELLNKEREFNSNYPDVVIIEEDMSDEKLKALYEQCDVLVSPSKAEGFGLPMAEAILSNLPVITTNWGGQLDFCNNKNSWLVDYEFEYAQTHFNIFGSVWAKPNVNDLSLKMQLSYETTKVERTRMSEEGKLLLLNCFKWTDVSLEFLHLATNLKKKNKQPIKPIIGWISSWKTKCGIATYSEHLIENFENSDITIFSSISNEEVKNDVSIRCWTSCKDKNELIEMSPYIKERNINTLIIQFNYGFYDFTEFSQFLELQLKNGIIVIVMLHSTHDPFGDKENWRLVELKEVFSKCHRLLVHSVSDLNRLKNIDLVDNVAIFPHGVLNYDYIISKNDLSEIPIVASYGFCLPHKGLSELLEATYILKKRGMPIRLKLVNAEYPVSESVQLINNLKLQIKKYGLEELVELNNKFLEDAESLEELAQADLLIFAYQNTGESASGAVRYGLATKRPVIVTPLKIFEDLGDSVFKFAGNTPQDIANGIIKTLEDIKNQTLEAHHILSQADRWRESNDYRIVGKRLENICKSLLINRSTNAQ